MATPIPPNAARFTLAEIARATGGELVAATPATRDRAAWSSTRARSRRAACSSRSAASTTTATRSSPQALARGARGRAGRSERAPRAATALRRDRGRPTRCARSASSRAAHRKRWGGRVVAITGSAGKTTTKELTVAALRAARARVLAHRRATSTTRSACR